VIHELREYTATPGSAAALHRRFADHTFTLFARHGIEMVDFWSDRAEPDRIVYLVRFPDEDARARAWRAFGQDPEWLEVKAASEAHGPLVATMTSRVLDRVPYWEPVPEAAAVLPTEAPASAGTEPAEAR
jgi:hypothetical protein